jgi:hypothetical protein
MPAGSKDGATSTQSNARKSIPVSARRYASASPLVGPPTSGVPVPGANAGSTKSMSNDRNAGASPTRARTRLPYSSGVSVRRRDHGISS